MPNYARFLSASLLAASAVFAADNPAPMVKQTKANYELAAQWTPAKMGKVVFDTTVTPHWLEQGDRFWYSFENSKGRKFYIVDPVKKTRTFVFDPVKLAAQLTTATGLPYESQHLPITSIKFVKNDTTIQFDLNVPKDAVIPSRKNLPGDRQATNDGGNGNGNDNDNEPQQQGRGGHRRRRPRPQREGPSFHIYKLTSSKLTLLDESFPAQAGIGMPTFADEKTIVFARNHNLYMMDAANYAKALKKADEAYKHVHFETKLTERWRRGFRLRWRPRHGRRPATAGAERHPAGRKSGTTPASAFRPATSHGRAIRRSSPLFAAIRARLRSSGSSTRSPTHGPPSIHRPTRCPVRSTSPGRSWKSSMSLPRAR